MNNHPYTVYQSEYPLIRIGNNFDGGYVISDIPIIKYSKLISAGIGGNITFEKQFNQKYKTYCHAFDGTINYFPESAEGITWHKENVGYKQNQNNLENYIKDSKNIFLKMDIEGSEWDWFYNIPEYLLNNISQMVVEFHIPHYNNILEKIKRTHTLIHIHGNNFGGKNIVTEFQGAIIPNLVETTWIKTDLLFELKLNSKPLPIFGLDYPNIKINTDYTLNYPPFCFSEQ